MCNLIYLLFLFYSRNVLLSLLFFFYSTRRTLRTQSHHTCLEQYSTFFQRLQSCHWRKSSSPAKKSESLLYEQLTAEQRSLYIGVSKQPFLFSRLYFAELNFNYSSGSLNLSSSIHFQLILKEKPCIHLHSLVFQSYHHKILFGPLWYAKCYNITRPTIGQFLELPLVPCDVFV